MPDELLTSLTERDVEVLLGKLARLRGEIGKVIVGQQATIEELLTAFVAGGHVLLEGVPGLAKTLLIRTLADAVELPFSRIQFTPDLMPTDIIGTEVLEEDHATGRRFFKFNRGPLFANVVLADEINRTPPKTQSALLEAMQEFSVTYGGETHLLSRPFFVLATQNPIEQAGTYPLPEAQLDRFLLYVTIGYPSEAEERDILARTTSRSPAAVEAVITGSDVLRLQAMTREVVVSDALIDYVNTLVRATRPGPGAGEYVREWVRWGGGPRAGQALLLTAKARSLLMGRYAVTLDDVHRMVYPALRHRILVNFKAEAEGITSDDVTRTLLARLPEPPVPLQ